MRKIIKLLFIALLISSCAGTKISRSLQGGTAPSEDFYAEIPFDFSQGLIVVPVKIQGKEYNFMFDTGAPNVLHSELLGSLDHKSLASQKVSDSQDRVSKLKYIELDEMELGGVPFKDMCLVTADLRASVNIGCLNYDGFIGGNLLRQAYWKIDYLNKLLIATNDWEKLKMPEDALEVPFKQYSQGTPKVNIHSGDVKLSYVTFDTGMMKAFNFPESLVKKEEMKNQLLKTNSAYGSKSSGLYGIEKPDTTFYGLVENLKIGEASIDSCLVEFNGKGARVGSGFLKDYDVYLKYDENKIFLVKKRNSMERSLYHFGFTPQFNEGKMLVGFVYNSLHGENVLKQNDQVLELDGVNYEEMTLSEWCAFITAKEEFKKDKRSIKIRRNNEVLEFDLVRMDYL